MKITGKFHDERLIASRLEQLYLYSCESRQIEAQTGYYGHLRGYFTSADEFCSQFFRSSHTPAEPDIRKPLETVMAALRATILQSFAEMSSFCWTDGLDGRIKDSGKLCVGCRINAENCAFLVRLTPERGILTQVDVFCYRQDWLDQHIDKSENGIRFITPDYEEKFRLEDGQMVCVTWPDGHERTYVCRYIDDYHTEIGGNIYHVCQYAELLAANGCTVKPAI